jgi:hypothetical protein
MIAAQVSREQGRRCDAPVRYQVVEQHANLRKLLRRGIAQVNAVATGQVLAFEPFRLTVAAVRDRLLGHLADAEELEAQNGEEDPPFRRGLARRFRERYAAELAELEILCAWPEERDRVELALRYETVGITLLDALDGEERDLLSLETMREAVAVNRNDFVVDDPFGC